MGKQLISFYRTWINSSAMGIAEMGREIENEVRDQEPVI